MPHDPKTCRACGNPIPERQILRAAAGIMGGKGKGKAKARTSEQARAAVNARWARHRARQAADPPPKP